MADVSNAIVVIDNTEPYLFLNKQNTIKFYVQGITAILDNDSWSAKIILRNARTGKELYSGLWDRENFTKSFAIVAITDANVVAQTETSSALGPYYITFDFDTLKITEAEQLKLLTDSAIVTMNVNSDNASAWSTGVMKSVIEEGTTEGYIVEGAEKLDVSVLYPDNYNTFTFKYTPGEHDNDSLLFASCDLTVDNKSLQKEEQYFNKDTLVWKVPLKAALLEVAKTRSVNSLPFVIKVSFITQKGLSRAVEYKFVIEYNKDDLFDKTFEFNNLQVTPNADKGVNEIAIEYKKAQDVTDDISLSGYIQLLRKDLTAKREWELIHVVPTILRGNATILIEDIIAEPGKPYLYQAQFYRRYYDGETANWVTKYLNSSVETATPAILITEDIFLVTKKGILRIAYNPELTQFKRNVVDQITTTIGGAYPFVSRNGKQRHKTFSLGGLLSYNREVTRFYTAEEIVANDSRANGVLDVSSETLSNVFTNFVNPAYYTGVSKNIKEALYEKEFREKVIDFLYSDDIILFKSMPEGNIIMRLTGVSMTPNAQLNRDIYSFTSQAVEVMENSVANCYKYFVVHAEDKIVLYNDLYLTVKEFVNNIAVIGEDDYQNEAITLYQENKEAE